MPTWCLGDSTKASKIILIKGSTCTSREDALKALLDITMVALKQSRANHIVPRAGHKFKAAGLEGMKGAGWYCE